MARTIKSTIEAALRKISALSESEQASADMIESAKLSLSELLQSWSVEGLMVPYISLDTLPGDTTKASYTWGPGGDINSVAPISVTAVSFILENGQRSLDRGDQRFFQNIPWLGIVGDPQFFYYERQLTPVLRFDVAPYGGAFNISSLKPLDSEFTLIDDLEFPDAYTRAIVNNLAIELCPEYEHEPSPVLMVIAASSKKIVKRLNVQPTPTMKNDFPGGGSGMSLPLRSS